MRTGVSDGLERILEAFDSLRRPALLSKDGRVLRANRSFVEIFGYSDEEIEGGRLGDLLGAPEDVSAGLVSGVAQRGGASGKAIPSEFETTCRRRNGTDFPALVSRIYDPMTERLVVIAQDLSDWKKIERRASQRTKELTVFSTLSEVLNRDIRELETLENLLDRLLRAMDADAAFFHRHLAGTNDLVFAAGRGERADRLGRVERLRAGECLPGKVWASKRPLLVRDAPEDPRVTCIDLEATGIASIAAAPVASLRTRWGVLSVASRSKDHFSSMDIQLLNAVGAQLGVALENASLIEQLEEKVGQIELINELSGTINTSLSIGTIFRIMVGEIRKTVGYDRASLLLYDEVPGRLTIFALDTEMKTVLPRGMRAPLEGTSAGWVARHNRPWINRDLKDEISFHLDGKLLREGIRSTISVPLFQDRMLGVFNLDSRMAERYTERDLEILLPVARQLSIALENALLFEGITKEKREWERTFDAITDMVWIEDFRQQVLRANRALLKAAGLSVSEVSRKNCDELLDLLGVESSVCICCETAKKGRETFRELKGTGGRIFHFWAYPLYDDTLEPYAIVHYLKDVTAQKRMEQNLIRADKLASLGTLMAGIAHEINNPLGIIAGYAEALLDRAGAPDLRDMEAFGDFPEYLQTIHNEIFRCKEILGGLLEFSRPPRTRARELDINEIIMEVILLVNHRAKRLRHRIDQRLTRDLPGIVAEAGSLRQLFMNILINSMYYTPEGGTISIDSRRHEDPLRGTMVEVVIRDSGSGIPADLVDRVFDPFFTSKPVGEGTGLGLSICHRIVQEHRGTIDVESPEGNGAVFTVRLPAKKNG